MRILEPGNGALTTKQLNQAVLDDELPDCVGNPNLACSNPRQPLLIKGFDDKMRCPSCNKIHLELVYEEAGNSDPNTPPRFVSPKLNQAVADRIRDEIRAKCAPRDGWTSPPQIRATPGDLVDMRGRRFDKSGGVSEPEKVESSYDERRKAILKKYSRRVDGNAMGA